MFGGTRRAVEGLAAQEENQRFQLEAAYLTLTSGVVAAAVGEAELRDQIAATEEIIRAQRVSLDILNKQRRWGRAAGCRCRGARGGAGPGRGEPAALCRSSWRSSATLIATLVGRVPSDQPAGSISNSPRCSCRGICR